MPGVRLLQIADPYILGGVDRQASEHLGEDSNQIDSYFVLDTRTGKNTILPNYESLQKEALRQGIRTELEPINAIYSRYRFSWFDVFTAFLFCVPPFIGFFLLLRRVVRLRQTRGLIPKTV